MKLDLGNQYLQENWILSEYNVWNIPLEVNSESFSSLVGIIQKTPATATVCTEISMAHMLVVFLPYTYPSPSSLPLLTPISNMTTLTKPTYYNLDLEYVENVPKSSFCWIHS